MYEDTANSRRRQLSEAEWAQAAGLPGEEALRTALYAGSDAEKRLVSEHKGFLLPLVQKFLRQVRSKSVGGHETNS